MFSGVKLGMGSFVLFLRFLYFIHRVINRDFIAQTIILTGNVQRKLLRENLKGGGGGGIADPSLCKELIF